MAPRSRMLGAGNFRLGSFFVVLIVAIISVGGCSGRPEMPETVDESYLNDLIVGMESMATEPDLFATVFREGDAPDDDERERYMDYTYQPESVPRPDGDVLDINVVICDPNDNQPITTLPWRFERIGGKWKAVSVPLPD